MSRIRISSPPFLTRPIPHRPVSHHATSHSNSDDPLARLKHPARGGQDLTNRYTRLERALRGKEGYLRGLDHIAHPAPVSPDTPSSSTPAPPPPPLVFAGLPIPDEPPAPQPDECCMSGCAVCVHDLYRAALAAHADALAALRSTLVARGVPAHTWPAPLRVSEQARRDKVRRDPVVSAFEQMEMQLAARRGEKEERERPRPEPEKAIRSPPANNSDTKDVLDALSWLLFSRR